MKRILITGAAGFVGSNLARRLVNDGFEVHAIVRPQSRLEVLEDIGGNIKIHTHNGTTQEMIDILRRSKPDVVFHLAAYFVAEHTSEDIDSLISSNILFGTQLLEAMREVEVNYLINTGTNWQHYDGDDYNPVDLYAATKQAFEELARFYTKATSLRMITLKLADTYGPNDPRPKLFSLLKRVAQTGENLKMSAGQQRLGITYIDDVVDAFIRAMELVCEKPKHYQEDFVILPDEIYSLCELVNVYEQVSGSKLNIEWGAREYRKREMMEPYRAETLPGWESKIDLPEGIGRMLKS